MNQRHITVISPPATEPLALSEVKSFLKIESSDEDVYLTGLIVATRQLIENYLHRALITQTLRLNFDYFEERKIELWRAPIQSITSVKTTDSNNAQTTISNTNYYLLNDYLTFNDNYVFSGSLRSSQAIEIIYIAGYGIASDVPQAIKNAMLEQIQNIYECGCDVASLSAKALTMLSPYRLIKIW